MKIFYQLFPLAFVLVLFSSCLREEEAFVERTVTNSPGAVSNDIVWEWTEEYLRIEKNLAGFRPAPTCRALAYINMGAYETAIPGMPALNSLSSAIPGFPALNLKYRTSQIDWAIALNAYYERTFQFFLFNASAADKLRIQNLYNDQLAELGADVPQGIINTSIEWGIEVANEVIAYSETDREGATQCRVPQPQSYFPPSGQGLWVPTSPDYNAPMFPYWGKVRTFAAQHGDLIALPPAAVYSADPNSTYYQENVEVANAVNNMTDDNHWIAEFWSDDLTGMTFSPPARIFAIANQLVSAEHMTMEKTLHLYCVLGIAINDAAVACWNSKYIYNTERPETYIRQYIDPNFRTILGEAINTPGISPAFPGYPSGHSTFAGVSWRIFEQFFGQQYDFTDHCHYGRVEFEGYPRTFQNWKEMAEENAFSRIPLGVHIRMDCVEGLRLGNLMGVRALDLELAK
jgi:hypothetical protein